MSVIHYHYDPVTTWCGIDPRLSSDKVTTTILMANCGPCLRMYHENNMFMAQIERLERGE